MTVVLVLNGPNLNLTGTRQPETYGRATLADINADLEEVARRSNIELRFFQSNHEGALIDTLHSGADWADGAIFNPGALTHYSLALRDAVEAVDFPVIEVHLSMPAAREEFRRQSVIAPACRAQVAGFGGHSYVLALTGLLALLEGRS